MAAPTFAAARYQLGVNLWNRFKRPIGGRQKQDLDDGIAQLTRAVEIRAGAAAVPPRARSASRRTAAPGAAIDHLRRALALAPDNPRSIHTISDSPYV